MNRVLKFIASPVLMVICFIAFAVAMAIATFVETIHSTAVARQLIFNAKWFELIMLVGTINLLTSIFVKKLYRLEKFTIFLFHVSFVVILAGAAITRYVGFEGSMKIREGESSNKIVRLDKTVEELPFSIFLKDFIIEYYPGSTNPSAFESSVILIDEEKNIQEDRRIYMNNILKHRGYRFYQSSYTKDQKGTILSVSKDALGTAVTYFGYFLLAAGMLASLINKNTRFRKLLINKGTITTCILALSFFSAEAQSTDSIPIIPKKHAEKFGQLLVRDFQGRTKPMNTLVSDILRKIHRNNKFEEQEPVQLMLGILVYPEKWQDVKLVYAGTEAADALRLKNKRASLFESYQGQGRFISSSEAYIAYQKPAGKRTKTENSILKFDERLNILYHWFMGNMLDIFPVPDDTTGKWYGPVSIKGKIVTEDSVFVENIISMYLMEVKKSVESSDWSTPDELVQSIIQYQRKYGTEIPSEKKVELEQWYYRSDIFKRSSYLYLLFGLLLLLTQLVLIFKGKKGRNLFSLILSGGLMGVLLLHSIGLAVRWYISGHAPWSNAYETMIFIAWSSVLAGSLYIKRNPTATAIAAIMASVFMVVANMAWMDPQITNLVPVLKSVWLVIHVAVITSSYGFLGIGSLMAFINLLLMSIQNRKNKFRSDALINNLSRIIELTITIGIYLLGIGTFLGAIWANVSWGRYWAWDPKETWALITVIIYAIVLHLRFIPALKSLVIFNISSLVAYSSVLMTYFGVNFYLSGLHSYAQGDPAPIPLGIYYTLGVVLLISISSIVNQKRLNKVT